MHNLARLAVPIETIEINSDDDEEDDGQVTEIVYENDQGIEEEEGIDEDVQEVFDDSMPMDDNYYIIEKLNCLVDGCRAKCTSAQQLDEHMYKKHGFLPYRCLLAQCGFSCDNE